MVQATSLNQQDGAPVGLSGREKDVFQRPLNKSEPAAAAVSGSEEDGRAFPAVLGRNDGRFTPKARPKRMIAGSRRSPRANSTALPRTVNDAAWERPQVAELSEAGTKAQE